MSLPKSTPGEQKLNDRTIRLIGVPAFGIIIPNVTGLFGPVLPGHAVYWVGYALFILLAFLIWEGNRYLMFRTRKRFTWFDKPIEKLILLLLNNIFFTSPLTVGFLCMWYRIAGFATTEWSTIQTVVLVNVICVLFVTHVYETFFMVREQQNEQVKNAELSRARAEAELAALKNQVDPHFMFNSLNSLSFLILTDPVRAAAFTETLANIYRYILSQREQSLVMLEDELVFTKQYADLLHIRFGAAFIYRQGFDLPSAGQFLIPPTSIFVALENAVKHNEISEKSPLRVTLGLSEGTLIVRNEMRAKKNIEPSSGVGLKNLHERFVMTTGAGVTCRMTEEKFFEVRLPLLTLEAGDSKKNRNVGLRKYASTDH